MNSSQHLSEESLITYHLQESADGAGIRRHVEECAECAALSESIAETLRVFSAEPVPAVDLDRNWHRLQGNLSLLGTESRLGSRLSGWVWWPAAGLVAAAIAVVIFAVAVPRHGVNRLGDLATLHRPGPLSSTPTNPQIAQQLDSAERLLTEVNHMSGPIDEATRAQAHDLLLKNAVYIRDARAQGDLGTASVLESLGQVLTNIDHAPELDDGWHLRLQWNTKGLLLDIRILRQNDARQ